MGDLNRAAGTPSARLVGALAPPPADNFVVRILGDTYSLAGENVFITITKSSSYTEQKEAQQILKRHRGGTAADPVDRTEWVSKQTDMPATVC